jgi:hypothetical protein
MGCRRAAWERDQETALPGIGNDAQPPERRAIQTCPKQRCCENPNPSGGAFI